MSNRERNVVVTILVILLPVTAFLAGYFTNDYVRYLRGLDTPIAMAAENEELNLALFTEAWDLIEAHYIGNLPEDNQLSYAAIRGSLASLDDPYTVFVEPIDHEQEGISLRGNFGGIGAYIQRNEAGEPILIPIPGNPAEAAGILEGDILLAIDGAPVTAEMTTEEIAQTIRGEKGTEVTLTVQHPGEDEPTDVVIERGDILVPSVISRILPDNQAIGYIQLSRFSGESAGEMEEALNELLDEGAEQIILDLRGNGGGLLDAAVSIADQFIAEGALMIQESKTDGERVYEATAETVAGDVPLLVLVDGGTASAAEILAGALQDYDRAELLGNTTFGKGSVQLVFTLSDGSSIHVTSARWLTPEGNQIDRQGLTPDIIVDPSAEALEAGRDEQLEEAIEYLEEER